MKLNDCVTNKKNKKRGIIGAVEFYNQKEHVRLQQVFVIYDDSSECWEDESDLAIEGDTNERAKPRDTKIH
jgi:hypothetical protein